MSDEEKNKYLDLEKFNYNKDDLFGHYAEIEMEFYGPEGNKIHLFKIISSGIQSNFYNDVPFNHHTKPAYIHKEMANIVKVVECGIDEEKIYRVPIKDIKILPTKQDKELETYKNANDNLLVKNAELKTKLETYKKIAEMLAETIYEDDGYWNMHNCYKKEEIIDWARKEVENG